MNGENLSIDDIKSVYHDNQYIIDEMIKSKRVSKTLGKVLTEHNSLNQEHMVMTKNTLIRIESLEEKVESLIETVNTFTEFYKQIESDKKKKLIQHELVNGFFKSIKSITGVFISIATAIGILWAFIKFVILDIIIKP
jgi:hypothetical protein